MRHIACPFSLPLRALRRLAAGVLRWLVDSVSMIAMTFTKAIGVLCMLWTRQHVLLRDTGVARLALASATMSDYIILGFVTITDNPKVLTLGNLSFQLYSLLSHNR